MVFGTIVTAAVAPFSRAAAKRKSLSTPSDLDTASETSSQRPLLRISLPSRQSFGSAHTHGYGSTTYQGPSSARSSPEMFRRDNILGRVPEEDDANEPEDPENVELDLEEQGYYIGSYKRKVALYSLVLISSLLVFLVLALFPSLIWHTRMPSSPSSTRYIPSPFPELLTSAALYALSHLLRLPLFTLSSVLLPPVPTFGRMRPVLHTVLFTAFSVLLAQLLRLAALPLLRVRAEMEFPLPTWQDPAFARVWWVALGWALADVAVGIVQGYEQLALYRDVMVPRERVLDLVGRWKIDDIGRLESGSARRKSYTPPEELPLSPRPTNANGSVDEEAGRTHRLSLSVENTIKLAVEKDLEQLVNLKEREDLEEIYGVPPIEIPVFISCLQRIDAFFLSLGLTLILSASYLRAPLSFSPSASPLSPIYSARAFALALPLVTLLHFALALLHAPPLLRHIGVHTMAYVGLLVGLGSVFAGLAFWGALD